MSRIVTFLFVIFAVNAAHADERFITLSSTTSTQDSGLFGYILPIFKSATGIEFMSSRSVPARRLRSASVATRMRCWSMTGR